MTVATAQPDNPVLDAALAYAELGWRVLPIRPGEKRPPMPAWQDAATTDTATITNWFTQLYRGHGVGIATGPESGVFVLDVDMAGGKIGDASLAALEEIHGPLPLAVEATTGSGGVHIFFAYPEHMDVRNSASGALGADLDIRGIGGQVVAAPTVHANGKAYRWSPGRSPYDVDVAEAPLWLLELLTTKPDRVTTKAADVRSDSQPTGPADTYNAATTWAELLERDGWTLYRTLTDGEQQWTRPGKDRREGMSATTGHDGRDVLKVFTSSHPDLPAEWCGSRFAYTAQTRYGGDQRAFSRDLLGHQADDLSWIPTTAVYDTETADEASVDGDDCGWEISDLEAVLAADYEPIRPTVLRRTDGAALFYEGRINALWGESGSAKSWLAQYASVEVIRDGRDVLYIDHEDTDRGQVERLGALGLSTEQIARQFLHISPQAAWTARAATYLAELLDGHDVALAVIDSTGEAMALDGAKPNDDDDTARWHRELPRFLTNRGITVVLIDHVPKNTEGAKLFAIGSQRKRAAIGGAAYMVDAKVSPAKDRDGHLVVTCSKDRHGTYPRGSLVADVDLVPSKGGTSVQITLQAHQKTDRPTVLMGRVSEYLEQAGGWHSTKTIEREVTGKTDYIRRAITTLVDEGFVAMEMRTGRGGGGYFMSLRPFKEGENLDFIPTEAAESF